MMSGKGCKCMKLCPVSLGLGLGVTAALAVFFWSIWIMNYGVPPMMADHMTAVPTLSDAVVHALWALLKGFIFGFFLALFYDLFASCMAKCCKKSNGEGCGCGPSGK